MPSDRRSQYSRIFILCTAGWPGGKRLSQERETQARGKMNDVELEDLLIKHFRLLRHSAGARESEISVARFAKLPPQADHLNAFDPASFDWKLDLARAGVCVLMGCAAAGVILGVFRP